MSPIRLCPCPLPPFQSSYSLQYSLHSHLLLQLPQFLFLVILLNNPLLPFNLMTRDIRQSPHFVACGHGAGVQHLFVELFLLEVCELLVQLVFVEVVVAYALCYGVGDFFADVVLFAESFPVRC